MAVSFNFLEAAPLQKVTLAQDYIFKDLKLDLVTKYSSTPGALKQNNVTDLEALYDYDAIVRSLANILVTSPGQKLLNPTFGLDLRRFLFTSVSPRIGFLLGLEFTQKLPMFEPRIKVEGVIVTSLPDDNSYNVDVSFSIPLLSNDKKFTLKGQLNSDGYRII